jgi:uncharacterized protein with HEPN domain
MRPDRLYLTDIMEAADAIERFLGDVGGMKYFQADELRQAAILQKLIVIGEAAARISPKLKQQRSDVEWADIIGFRNIAVHAYFSVDWAVVWITATKDVPRLREQIEAILAVLPNEE